MLSWQPIRIALLAITCSGALSVLGKSVLLPLPEKEEIQSFGFPTNVPLPGWQLVKSQTVAKPTEQIYQYSQGDRTLSIEMQYIDHPHANEKVFRQYSPTAVVPGRLEAIVRHNEDTGFYGLSIEEQRAYLRTCINPQGKSTITYEQFIQNRYTADLSPDRLLQFAIGQEPLRDHRCLWTHLSIPINNGSSETAYQALETAWIDWYKWWQPRFPKR